MNQAKDVKIKRLRYQAWHRGCKETDVILGQFCDEALDVMSDEELSVFETFLEEDDHDIWQWVAFSAPIPRADYAPIIQALQNRKVSA